MCVGMRVYSNSGVLRLLSGARMYTYLPRQQASRMIRKLNGQEVDPSSGEFTARL